MKKLLSFILFLLSAVYVNAQADTTKIMHGFADHLSMLIPSDVKELSADMIRAKYRKTKDANTNFYGDADASFSIVTSVVMPANVKEEDMVKHKDQILASIKASHKLLSEEVRTVNKHKLIVVSFYSDVVDGRVLNKRFFATVNQKLVSIEMNTTEVTLAKRGPQMEAAINSVLIK